MSLLSKRFRDINISNNIKKKAITKKLYSNKINIIIETYLRSES